jgi:hypothetical protein
MGIFYHFSTVKSMVQICICRGFVLSHHVLFWGLAGVFFEEAAEVGYAFKA